jgi:dihydrolipoamide dehydrogenase
MLVSVGRAALVDGVGLEAAGVAFDKTGIQTDEHRRTSVPHIYAAGDVAGYWQLAHTGFREGEVAAENAMGHEAVIPESPAVPRPIYTDPEIAGVGLTEGEAREQHGSDVAVGRFPWVANARSVMYGETGGWVKSIHETTYGELLGVVIVGAHATDLIEAAVVALDAEATVETVADGMTAHPTLSEGIKEAGLVALDRAIHLPPRRKATA